VARLPFFWDCKCIRDFYFYKKSLPIPGLLHLIPLNEILKSLSVRIRDGNKVRADLNLSFMDGINRFQCYNIRMMYPDEFICR
jgi:hypothetical protein